MTGTLLVLSDLWVPFPGGAERLAFNLARDLCRRGWDVRVLTGYEAAQVFDGPPVCRAELGIGPSHDQGWAVIAEYIETVQPRVIVTHHLYAFEFADELHATGIPVVQLVLNTRRLPFARFAVFISRFVAEMPGVRPHTGDLLMYPMAFDDVIAPTYGHGIGFIKPIEHKGVELVYEIAALMPEQEFVVLRGEWQDLEVLTDLPNVRYLEPVDDIRDFYSQVRLVLMPSISEDAGTVAQECTLNGIPCISSDVGGLAETNRGGLRLASRDPHTWVRSIRHVLRAPEEVVALQREQGPNRERDRLLDLFAYRVGCLMEGLI